MFQFWHLHLQISGTIKASMMLFMPWFWMVLILSPLRGLEYAKWVPLSHTGNECGTIWPQAEILYEFWASYYLLLQSHTTLCLLSKPNRLKNISTPYYRLWTALFKLFIHTRSVGTTIVSIPNCVWRRLLGSLHLFLIFSPKLHWPHPRLV